MRKAVSIAFLFCLVGCGLPNKGSVSSTTVVRSLDAVKLISPEFVDGNDPATFDQDQYKVTATHRLLLRFEGFGDSGNKVDLSSGKTMALFLTTLSETNADQLQVCPVTTNWMMLATWHFAHPFSGEGKWKAAGGDHEAVACVSGTLVPAKNGEKAAAPFVYTFDMTQWAKNYLQAHGKNFGFLLKGPASVWIVGERSSTYSPRIEFSKLP